MKSSIRNNEAEEGKSNLGASEKMKWSDRKDETEDQSWTKKRMK